MRGSLGNLATGVHDDAPPAKRSNGIHHMLDHEDGNALAMQRMDEGDAFLQLGRIETGQPFVFEIMVSSSQQERLALNFAQSLTRIGVQARVRLVDKVQYWRRMAAFEFDMVQASWAASLSPGNEQRSRWSSAAAGQQGSLNYAGAASPAIDAMIDALLSAQAREDFVAAVRALEIPHLERIEVPFDEQIVH